VNPARWRVDMRLQMASAAAFSTNKKSLLYLFIDLNHGLLRHWQVKSEL
jgi:hypothetical protein